MTASVPADRRQSVAEFTTLIGDLLAGICAELGIPVGSADEAADTRDRYERDFAQLGLGSLDWMRLAVLVGNETGLDLPDDALLRADRRTVAGWAEALADVAEPR
jgi:acyl carrier protein